MQEGQGGSVDRALRWMLQRWGENRVRHLALYRVGSKKVYWAWVADSRGEARWLAGHGGFECLYRGGY